MIVKLIKRNAEEWAGVKFYKNCGHALASYYTRSGRRYTGLDKEEAERLGKELSYDLRPESTFWDNPIVRLTNEKDYFLIDTSDALGLLRYKFCKNHKRVAQSFKDINPTKDFVLVHEEIEAEQDNKVNRTKIKAFLEFGKMTPEEMRKALRLFGINSVNSSNELIENTLAKIVNDSPDNFINIWVNNKDREVSYLIEEAVSKNIIRKNNTIYKYGTDIIGYTLPEAVDYLKNPSNTDVRISILGQLEGKMEMEKTRIPKKVKEVIEVDKTVNDN
jgi:hypothetical protein